MELIKAKMGPVTIQQYEEDLFRVAVNGKTVINTSNGAEAMMWFSGEVERIARNHIKQMLIAQGIDPMSGARRTK